MLQKLIESIRPKKQQKKEPTDVVVEDGFLIDRATGRVLRRELTLDNCKPYDHHPIYVYCRATRFESLIMRTGVPLDKQVFCLKVFCELEKAWLNDKKLLRNRTYFLSQRLVLSQICRLNDIKYKFSNRRPIRDKRRWRIQQKMFTKLLEATERNKIKEN